MEQVEEMEQQIALSKFVLMGMSSVKNKNWVTATINYGELLLKRFPNIAEAEEIKQSIKQFKGDYSVL